MLPSYTVIAGAYNCPCKYSILGNGNSPLENASSFSGRL
jgi:hypothetical protein